MDESPFVKALGAHGTLGRCGLPVRAIDAAFSRTSTFGTERRVRRGAQAPCGFPVERQTRGDGRRLEWRSSDGDWVGHARLGGGGGGRRGW